MKNADNELKTFITLGVGPVPVGNPDRVYAPGLRLFSFSRLVAESGFRVIMGEASFGGEQSEAGHKPEEISPGWERRRLPLDPRESTHILKKWIAKEKPAGVISTTDVMNLAASLTGASVPLWLDFNGPPMVERQEIGYVCNSDEGLIDQWRYLIPSLLAGDRFSACSTPQKYALIGELGGCGRLNRLTSGCDLVSVLPPGPVHHEKPGNSNVKIRGKDVPENAFCLLWTGGFNTWVDEKTLYEGVSLAMKKSSRLHFLITGGEIRGHDEKTFFRFRKRVENDENRERFHFYGWVPLEDLPAYYDAADAAVNIDRFTYEALLGCRNRVFSWICFGIPVLTTPLSEITRTLVSRKMAAGFSVGDAASLAECLGWLENDPASRREMAARAEKFLREEYTNEKLLKPLENWIHNPEKSPDVLPDVTAEVTLDEENAVRIPDNPLCLSRINEYNRGREFKKMRDELRSLRSRIAGIENSRSWKALQNMKKILGKE